MTTPSDPTLRLVFGPFELHPSKTELRKRGVRVRLAGQPFEILFYLMNHSGELVTREQLRELLWKDGTFVDFEGGLNAAMSKLRRALDDSAENPRYIETVPGQGYRFIGTFQTIATSPTLNHSDQPTHFTTSTTTSETQQQTAKVPTPNRYWKIAIAVCLAALVIMVGAFFYSRRATLTGKGDIVLAAFVNRTGEPLFDETLRQGLAVELQESPFLKILSDERIRHTLSLMGQPADAKLTPELAREVCVRTASAAFLEGSITLLGSQYVLGLTAKSCAGDTLDEEQVKAASKEEVLSAITQIGRKFRVRAGESVATIRRYNAPLAEATTPSLDALQAYTAARKAAFTTGFTTAVPLLQRAIHLDPQFATAHAFLGRIYADIGESVLSIDSTKRAYALRNHASDPERFFITFSYYRQITGDLAKAQQTLELWAQTYPRDDAPHSLLSGSTTSATAQYEVAMDHAQKAIALNPDATPAYLNLAEEFLALGRVAEAENTLQRAAERKLEIADSLELQYFIAFLRNDRLGMDRELVRAKDEPGAEDWMFHWEALVAANSGRLLQARKLSERAIDLALRDGRRERAAMYVVGTAVREGLFGNAPAARRRASDALKLSMARDVEYGAGIALALAGDTSRSEALADDLESRFPDDTFVMSTYGPTLRALCALNRHETVKAIDKLRPVLPYELALPWTRLFGGFGSLYPAYVRGNAYLGSHRGAEAVAEFQKILNHRGLVLADPVGAVASLQLGRALALSGDKVKAKAAYQDFLALWKNADPDIPILRQAKVEYTKVE